MGQASKDNLAALGRTLIFSFFVTTVQFGLGLAAAVLLNNPRIRIRNLFRTLYFMPVILGAVIQGMTGRCFSIRWAGRLPGSLNSSARLRIFRRATC
jgi:ABC-type sugar transport system permease subunit